MRERGMDGNGIGSRGLAVEARVGVLVEPGLDALEQRLDRDFTSDVLRPGVAKSRRLAQSAGIKTGIASRWCRR